MTTPGYNPGAAEDPSTNPEFAEVEREEVQEEKLFAEDPTEPA